MVIFPKHKDDGTIEWICPVCRKDNKVYTKTVKNVKCLNCGHRFVMSKGLNGFDHG